MGPERPRSLARTRHVGWIRSAATIHLGRLKTLNLCCACGAAVLHVGGCPTARGFLLDRQPRRPQRKPPKKNDPYDSALRVPCASHKARLAAGTRPSASNTPPPKPRALLRCSALPKGRHVKSNGNIKSQSNPNPGPANRLYACTGRLRPTISSFLRKQESSRPPRAALANSFAMPAVKPPW
ncbi:hypothetical protein HNQ50_002379 [Silvimonas terrae]|uniref:Uncharacterized protein n=1 Tax=Silvimonas terrae TaxID=300266 RepID=A0A840RDS6_9NEIS|nr:hypothetical protein [Silvimonas terrae]